MLRKLSMFSIWLAFACSLTWQCKLVLSQSPAQIPRPLGYFHPDPLVMLYPIRQVFVHPHEIWDDDCTLGNSMLSREL
jgi:hypothetical protein